ncbi:hypothetical protein CF15_02520 [Pyrodictium occultum]|uniref:Phosphomevalonate dehydratase small subunit-like domain-containing protein n=1 Tax=Pyrodictium occultum TaxID=2309 RepID=A0A0V8RUF9_PYROC|nr:DUF126 domain-containing protein [Pyrodictium occultum]KSW11710.1 hypothetical protein CF15_02520 [Pyrodictium occultum]
MPERRVKLRGIVEGNGSGETLVVHGRLSFYGEVDPERGTLTDGRSIAGRVLIMEGGRGSTVGPYILYALARRGLAPSAIAVVEAEPILVAGAVMASVPLASGLPPRLLEELRDGCRARLYSKPPSAMLIVEC